MCGIAGIVMFDPRARADEARLRRMCDAIRHRGPDDSGLWIHGPVGLGHRRLSIVDVASGHQPMTNEDGTVWITFNGEIYNHAEMRPSLEAAGHRYQTRCDTETILHLYEESGDGCVDRLQGMFAFAIWDGQRERMLLARDRFGEKPLFLHENANGLYFASEIKALLCIPGVHAEVNPAAVWDYLAYRYVPAPNTLFNGIRKLMPGTKAVWERGTLTESRYWSAPDRKVNGYHLPEGDVVETFLTRLDRAVELQMVSDVPFGAFLSGGIDSSTIVALMSRHNSKINTFSVGFGDAGFSELGYAAEVARHFGTSHHELTVTDRDMVERLPALVAFRDAPVSEPSDIPIYMLACEAGRSVKMVLTGEGSDEILGGYPKHVVEAYTRPYQWLPGSVRHRLIEPLAQALPYDFRRVKTAVTNLNIEDWRERYVRWFGALSYGERERLAVTHFARSTSNDDAPFDADPHSSSLRRMLYFDQVSWLPDNLLERADRMTMAASIEARVPFLDHELAAFVSSLPDRFRVRGRRTKWILRAAAAHLLPSRILNRRKVGFRVPVNKWFRGPMRDFLVNHLQSASSMTRSYFDHKVLDRILADHLSGRQNSEKLLWSLLNLEIWHRHFVRT